MFGLKGISVAFALAITAVALPTSHVDFKKTVAETVKVTPAGWVKDASQMVDKDATSITLKIHIVNKDMDKFHERAMNVSARSSKRNAGLRMIPRTGCDTRPCFIWPAHVSRRNSSHDRPSRGF
jgi:hypothetical protein